MATSLCIVCKFTSTLGSNQVYDISYDMSLHDTDQRLHDTVAQIVRLGTWVVHEGKQRYLAPAAILYVDVVSS